MDVGAGARREKYVDIDSPPAGTNVQAGMFVKLIWEAGQGDCRRAGLSFSYE